MEGGPEGGAVPRLATGGARAARRAARSLGPVVFAVQGRALAEEGEEEVDEEGSHP